MYAMDPSERGMMTSIAAGKYCTLQERLPI